jgi:uncharacterized protein (DUF1330 family)
MLRPEGFQESRMPAYVISDIRPLDPEAMKRYRELAAASIARHGGRYLVRAGAVETLESDWSPEAIVVVEFPDMEQARQWYASADYADALNLSKVALTRRLILVEGVA